MKLHLLLLSLLLTHSFASRLIHGPIIHQDEVQYKPDTLMNLRGSALPRASIKNFSNSKYKGVFQVGSQKQDATLTLDTGSSKLWVSRYKCNVSPGCVANTSATTSSSYTGAPTKSGYKFVDALGYGEAAVPSFTMYLQDNIDDDGTPAGGIIGLSPLSSPKSFPVALKEAGVTPSSSFAIFLGINNSTDSTPVVTGEITFGGYNPALIAPGGSFRWLKMVPPINQWRVAFNGLAIGGDGKQPNVDYNKTLTAIFDTGNPSIVLPSDLLDLICDELEEYNCAWNAKYGVYQADIKLLTSGPTFTWFLGDQGAFEVPAASYTTKWYSNYVYLNFGSTSASSINFGDDFLQYWYSMYNYDNQTVGLAQAATSLPKATPINA